MKHTLKIMIALMLSLTVNAQSIVYYSETGDVINDRDRLILKSNVKTMQRVRYDADLVKLDGGNLWTTMNTEFNSDGNVISETTYDESDQFMARFTVVYQNAKPLRPKKKSIYNVTDDLVCTQNYTTYNDGRIKRIVIKNENNVKTSAQFITYEDKELTVEVKDILNVVFLTEVFTFDVDYNLTYHTFDLDTIKNNTTFTHNGSKDIMTAFHSKQQKSSVLTLKQEIDLSFVYTYDGSGNWTRKDTYHEGILKEIVMQSLTYF